MGGILDYILARRSIRRFAVEQVSKEQVDDLLHAAMAAPSASNRRPWEFIVLTDPECLSGLRARLPLGRYQAPVAIVVCGNRRLALPQPVQDFWIQDCSAATQNMLLAASGMGLGAVWIGVHPVAPLRWAVAQYLGLPRHIVPLNVVWIGYPAEHKEPRTQYSPERVHWEHY